jgi:hypothetical protein
MLDQEATKKALEKFRRNVVRQARQNAQKKTSSGNLAKSIKSKLNLEFVLAKSKKGAPYGSFVDKGVSGTEKRYSGTEYKYKKSGKKPPASAFEGWIKKRGLKGRDKKTGRFISNKSLSFILANHVYKKGIKPSLYFTKPFEKEFKKLPDVLADAYGLDVEKFVDDVIKENFK